MLYIIAPNTIQWCKNQCNEILENHKLVICGDQLTHMVPIPLAELQEIKTITLIARLTFLLVQDKQISNTLLQLMYSDITLDNQNTNNSHHIQNTHSNGQSTVILQQFSMMRQELRNFMDKVSSEINKIVQACTAAQENTGKIIEMLFCRL